MEGNKFVYTHRVAVNAYLLKESEFLLLKRKNEPRIWAPPGGRLMKDEEPLSGLHREVKEETNLDIEIVAPVNTWFGKFSGNQYLLSIDYLAVVKSGEISLSDEHSAYQWVTLSDLIKGSPILLDSIHGFQVSDFQKAYHVARCWQIVDE